jgi:hypothetical protein
MEVEDTPAQPVSSAMNCHLNIEQEKKMAWGNPQPLTIARSRSARYDELYEIVWARREKHPLDFEKHQTTFTETKQYQLAQRTAAQNGK